MASKNNMNESNIRCRRYLLDIPDGEWFILIRTGEKFKRIGVWPNPYGKIGYIKVDRPGNEGGGKLCSRCMVKPVIRCGNPKSIKKTDCCFDRISILLTGLRQFVLSDPLTRINEAMKNDTIQTVF